MKSTSLSLVMTFCVSLISVPSESQAGWLSFLEPAHIIEKIRGQISKQEIGASLGLIDGELFRGFSTALRYRLDSEPSYIDGYYTRVDRYSLEAQINPGDLLQGGDVPFGFHIDQGTEVLFARQFKSQGDSLKATPYTLKNIPLSAAKAISGLKVGDFVALQANLGIVFSLEGNAGLSPSLDIKGSTHVYLSGDFMIHLFRMDQDKIRVKLITLRKQGSGGNIDLDYSRKFKVIGLTYVDNKIGRLVDLTPLSLGFGKGMNDVFMLDYVFDLKNPVAALAFDNFMTRKLKFKDLKVIDPTASRTDLTEDLLTDMSEIEQLAFEDRDLPTNQRRIDRVFKGSNSSKDVSSSFKLGLSLFKLRTGAVYSQNKLLSYDKNDQQQKFLLDTYTRELDSRIFFGLFGDKVTSGNNVVFNSDDSWSPSGFVTLTSYQENKLRSVSGKDYRKIQDLVRATIPADEYIKIDWKPWDFSHGSFINGYFRQQLFVNPEALVLLPRWNESQFYQSFIDYVKANGAPPRRNLPGTEENNGSDWTSDYAEELWKIACGIAQIVKSPDNAAVLYQDFTSLQQFDLWRTHGVGFIVSLLPQGRANSQVSYEMTFAAANTPVIQYKYGTFANSELYKTLMYIQNIINNRSFDLRLLTYERNQNFKR